MFQKKLGFTLVELLVVIAIIGILMAIALPVVSSARERGRMVQCSNNMHQVAIAQINYEQAKNQYQGFVNDMNSKMVCYLVPILPYMEQHTAFELWQNSNLTAAESYGKDRRTRSPYIGTLQCISDAPPDGNHPWLSYIGNTGCINTLDAPYPPRPDKHYRGQPRREGVFVDRVLDKDLPQSTSFIRSNDGVAYTLMLSENIKAGMWAYPWDTVERSNGDKLHYRVNRIRTLTTFMWRDPTYPPIATLTHGSAGAEPASTDEPPWSDDVELYLQNPTWDDQQIPKNKGPNWNYAVPSSRHSGGSYVAFCDGRVSYLSSAVNPMVFIQMMTPAGDLSSWRAATADNNDSRPGPLEDGTY
jgi:prepilin-type N-terminal cleavage/methylation domain-containing protein/prepilin-type processing-associated H-X9-DG protein